MVSRSTRWLAVVLLASCTTEFGKLPPLEQNPIGFGRSASGGTLRCVASDYPSFRACVEREGSSVVFSNPEIVVPEDETEDIQVASHVRVRGETGTGATLRLNGRELVIAGVEDVVIYGLRIDGGNVPSRTLVRICGSRTVRLDHITAYDAESAAIVIDDSADVTVSHSLLYRANAALSIHERGCGSQYGNAGITIARNVIHGIGSRAPRVMGNADHVEILNNIVAGWLPDVGGILELGDSAAREPATDIARPWGVQRLNFIGNRYVARAAGFQGEGDDAIRFIHTGLSGEFQSDQGGIFAADNRMPGVALDFPNPAATPYPGSATAIGVTSLSAEVLPIVGAVAKEDDEMIRDVVGAAIR